MKKKYKYKPIRVEEIETYVIPVDEFNSLREELNARQMIILQINPTYVATNISDDFIIKAIRKEKRVAGRNQRGHE
jgi:hypothetical protein